LESPKCQTRVEIGSFILQFFGVTIPAVRVAGGALVTFMGWNLLNGGDGSTPNHRRRSVHRAWHATDFIL